MRLAERQASLKSQYHFVCKCCICINPHIDSSFFQIIEGLACLLCKNEIQATLTDLDVSNTVACDLCSKQLKTSEYKKKLVKANNVYYEGKISNKMCITLFSFFFFYPHFQLLIFIIFVVNFNFLTHQ